MHRVTHLHPAAFPGHRTPPTRRRHNEPKAMLTIMSTLTAARRRRASSSALTLDRFAAGVGPHSIETLRGFFLALIGIAVVMGAEILQGRINMRQAIDARPAWMRWSLYYVGTLTVVLLGAFYGTQTAFIYFRF